MPKTTKTKTTKTSTTKTTNTVKESQTTKILKYLTSGSGRVLTASAARERFGVTKMSARICELRDMGHPIETVNKRLRGGGVVTGYQYVG